MMGNMNNVMGFFEGSNPFLLLLFVTWSLTWKGLALWRAAELRSKPWFIALLLVNTVGILEILYIYIFSKRSKMTSASQSPSAPK